MEGRERMEEIALREKENRLSMSRVPKKTKDIFLALADDEFAGDYGLTLKAILDGYLMWKLYFENMDMKLDQIKYSISQLNTEQMSDGEEITMLNGKKRRRE